jgi:hypothetical protein
MFKQRKPRGFGLKGRYYDEDKERRDNLLRRNEDEIPFGDKEKYRERLRKNWEYRRITSTSKNFGGRLIIILAVLVILIYALLFIF